MNTLRNLLLAWVLTLPVCIFLGACFFAGGLLFIARILAHIRGVRIVQRAGAPVVAKIFGSIVTALAIVATLVIYSRIMDAQETDTEATATAGGSTSGRLSEAELRQRLTEEQYHVTMQCGTEPPFSNACWDNHAPGIYVDVISGEPLFTSLDKFDSGTGWPSFTQPIEKEKIAEKSDLRAGRERTEVRTKTSDAHLGHVFADGPQEKGGMRYCINSASLRFVPVEKLQEEGYERYLPLFEGKN